ncbi:TPA: TOPRIM nucleotidyl transferase/hydrolase domain-containing protein, partial [Vibrio parahaemolyticus]
GINDLVQSIISSITSSDSKWIICEGASDRVYLEHYLKGENIHILSVGGSKYVKKFYEYIYLALDEERSDIKGKMFFILDTDKKFEKYDSKSSIKSVKIKRLKNDLSSKDTKLLLTSHDDFYPPTEIEDVLMSEPFFETLKTRLELYDDYDKLKNIFSDNKNYSKSYPSGIAFDLRESEKEELDCFFNEVGEKINFANNYCKISDSDDKPIWINEIVEFMNK